MRKNGLIMATSSKKELGEKLITAAIHGNGEEIVRLLKQGADIDAKDEDCQNGKTALMFASKLGHLDSVKKLLDHGANVNMQDELGLTALHWAILRGNTDCAKVLLLETNLNVNKKDKDGKTALLLASEFGYLECVKGLLNRGAKVDTQDRDRKTALMWSSEKGHLKCVNELLVHRANVNIQDKDGMTAVMLAHIFDHSECVETLKNSGAICKLPDKEPDARLSAASKLGEDSQKGKNPLGMASDWNPKVIKQAMEAEPVSRVEIKWSPACCAILYKATEEHAEPLEPDTLESLVEDCRKVFMNEGFPLNYSEQITVDRVQDWFSHSKQHETADWTTQSLVILYEAFSKNPYLNEDDVSRLCEQCQNAGDKGKTFVDVKSWFDEKRTYWNIKKSEKVNEKTDFREQFHCCEEFSHPSTQRSHEKTSEGFRPVHCRNHIVKIKELVTQCLTDEQKQQIIVDIEHEIEVVDYITQRKDTSKLKARLCEVKNNVMGSWNIESIIQNVLDPLCNSLTQVECRGKKNGEVWVVVLKKEITEFGVNNHLEQVLHYLIGDEHKTEYSVSSIHHVGSFNSYTVVLSDSMIDQLRFSSDIGYIESVRKGHGVSTKRQGTASVNIDKQSTHSTFMSEMKPTTESTTVSTTESTTVSTTESTTVSTTESTTVSTTESTTVSTTESTTSTSDTKPTAESTTSTSDTKLTTESTATSMSNTKPTTESATKIINGTQKQGQGVTVYFLDDGIDVNHPDFGGRAKDGPDYTGDNEIDKGHGTHLAGIVMSNTYGIAKQAEAMSVRVLDSVLDVKDQKWVLDGLNWVYKMRNTNECCLVCMAFLMNAEHETPDGSIEDMIKELVTKFNICCIVAAGNFYKEIKNWSPARLDSCVTVMACTNNLTFWHDAEKEEGSNYGTCCDFIAQGVGIVSLGIQNDRSAFIEAGLTVCRDTGTSVATAKVCGIVAKYLTGRNQNPPVQDIKQWLHDSSKPDEVEGVPADTANMLLSEDTIDF